MTAPGTRAAAEAAPAGQVPGVAMQWVGLLLAPATFFAHLQLGYVLVYRACRYHTDLWVHLAGATSVALAAFGTWTAWRVWTRTGRTMSIEEAGAVARARFLGITGVGSGALFVLLLFSQWMTACFLSPCQ